MYHRMHLIIIHKIQTHPILILAKHRLKLSLKFLFRLESEIVIDLVYYITKIIMFLNLIITKLLRKIYF